MNRDAMLRFLKRIFEAAKEEGFTITRDSEVEDSNGEFMGYLEMDRGSAFLVLDGEVIVDSAELDSET